GEQGPDKGERQRKQRMAESDERGVGAKARDHHDKWRTDSAGTPLTRYSSTSVTLEGTSTAMSAAALCGAMVPCDLPKPRASAPTRVALSSREAAATSGAMRRISASSSNTLSVGVDARLSVPTATCTPDA